uniref:DUF2116 family Zn-ribbon domain-containing protein n=1 Tax=Roseihalotalea indica TaxID=2867963 RepID=A0AA49GIP4_9BACT|nr:DUF2116 family Zn-ribbon domain-containing protein [Tunicatimonas sp. TK19036]
MTKKTCVVCQTSFEGRTDKVFCSDHCRTAYHNQQRKEKNHYLRKVNKVLTRNRDILQRACPDTKRKVNKALLLQQGFQYGYFTGQYETQYGHTYYYCYDYGYRVVNEEEVIVVRLQPNVQQHLESIVREDDPGYKSDH